MNDYISWIHFGDLHITDAQAENYLDLRELIAEANNHLAGDVDFAFLPGDNADDGAEEQYQLVRGALERLKIPVQAIAGDHDRKSGSLDLFRQYLEPNPYRALTLRRFELLFLNAMDAAEPKEFDFSAAQIEWLESTLKAARAEHRRPLVFNHLYPSELVTNSVSFIRLIREFNVELVEMGHTHYNELANDGRTIYAVTRSTGQIEEGPPGFSLTTIDDDVVSWKFKERGVWPFVMITSPCDEALITRPESPRHVVRGEIVLRAKVWPDTDCRTVECLIGSLAPRSMELLDGFWQLAWNSSDVPDGSHRVLVRATCRSGLTAQDEITIYVNQAARYAEPSRKSRDYDNMLGAYPAKQILGTQLGPNEFGTKGPWPSWRAR